MNKFDWQASESGPKGYPMTVLFGTFFYPEGGGLSVPSRATLNGTWGQGRSSHVIGSDLKPLPNRLDITFLSHVENKIFHGEFNLPYDKIVALFNTGYYSPNMGKKITYRRITAGILPGGGVSVWLSGIQGDKEVFFGQAEEANIDWSMVTDSALPRAEYVQLGVTELLTPEEIEKIKKEGAPVDKWNNYRVRYKWKPRFKGMKITDDLIIQVKYYNGETGYLYSPENSKQITDTLAVPYYMVFIWERGERGAGHDLSLEIRFDEKEIFNAFKKLGVHNLDIRLEYRMEIDKKGKQGMYIWLLNSKESILLQKVKVKSYGVMP